MSRKSLLRRVEGLESRAKAGKHHLFLIEATSKAEAERQGAALAAEHGDLSSSIVVAVILSGEATQAETAR